LVSLSLLCLYTGDELFGYQGGSQMPHYRETAHDLGGGFRQPWVFTHQSSRARRWVMWATWWRECHA
jgi:hypothetical protein